MVDVTQDKTTNAKSAGSAKAGQEKESPLGLSKFIYGAGYSARNGYIYAILTFLGTFATIFIGERMKIPQIQWVTRQLQRFHQWWEKQKGQWMGAEVSNVPIFPLAGVVSFFAGHFLAGPAFAKGMKKGGAIIEEHNRVIQEKNELIETAKVLMEDKARLEAELEAARKERPSLTERVRTQAPTEQGLSA